MARFNASEADNYGGQGGTGFFSLKNDMDVAQVRFMYNGIDDVEGLSVHKVEVGDKDRYVNCLRAYNDPIEDCPFCREGKFTQAKLFIPLYDETDGRVKIWERGKKFFNKISGLCSRYPNLVEHLFEIERHGKPKDTNTTYEIFPVDGDKVTLDELPEVPEILGGFVLDKSAEDMEYYLEEGEFPPTDDDEEEAPTSRRTSRNRRGDDEVPFDNESKGESRRSARRTPASNRRRGSDGF